MFSVYFANQAKKFLKNADKILSERIMSKIEKLKVQANIDVELLGQLMESFKDIKEGRIRRVK